MRVFATMAAVAVALLLAVAAPVRADEETSGSALERLTDVERARLEKIPGWTELSHERQERVARNLLRYRDLPEAERARLEARIERLEGARRAGRGPSPHHPRRGPPDEGHRRRLGQRVVLVKAVGQALWADLPAEARQAIETTVGPDGRRGVEMAFFRRLWDHLARAKASGDVADLTVPDDLPPHVRRLFVQWRERAAAGDASARRRLGAMAIGRELHELVKGLESNEERDAKALARVAALLKERHAEAYQAALAELMKAAEDPEGLRSYARRGHFGGGRGGERRAGSGSPEERARRLLYALEQAAPYLEGYPALERHANALREGLRAVLGDDRGRGGHGRRPGGAGPRGPRGPRGPGSQGRPGRPDRPDRPGGSEDK